MRLQNLRLVAACMAALGSMNACEYTYSDDCGLVERSTTDRALLTDETAVTTSPVILNVKGMSCPKCISNVDLQLKRIDGVVDPKVDMKHGVVSVTVREGAAPTRASVAAAIGDAGFTLTEIREVPR